jgi:hypothetical protein
MYKFPNSAKKPLVKPMHGVSDYLPMNKDTNGELLGL